MIQEVRFYLSLFLRRLHYFILALALGTGIGVTLAMILPPNYVAAARLVVESEQIPDTLASSTVHTQALEQLQIIQQRILSREKLLDMANRLNIYGDSADASEALRPDEIVANMRQRIGMEIEGGVTPPGRREEAQATLVQVSFTASSAQLAAAVTNEIVTLILDENIRMRTGVSGQTLQFFDQEVQRLDKELAERRAKIVTFQEENKEALPDSLEFRRTQFSTAQSRVLQLEAEEQTLISRRDSIKALYEATGQLTGDEALEDMTAEARELARLRERYASWTGGTEVDNPRIRVLRERIAALEGVVAKQEAETAAASGQVGEDGKPLTPVDIQVSEIDSQIRAVQSERDRLNKDLEELGKTIEATPSNAVALETLQRDYDNIRAQYDGAVSNRARAETGDLIEALSKGERISIIEQAIPPEEPTSPNRPRLVAAGVGGGMFLGFAIIALMELLNNSIRRPSEIVNKLDIIPMTTLSYIRTAREIRRRRAIIGGAIAVALIGIPLSLWLINDFYMPLDLLWEKVATSVPGKVSLLPHATAVTAA